MKIIEEIGEAAMLEQLAEECTELAKAALKMARIIRKENPTPVTEKEAMDYIHTEAHQMAYDLSVYLHKKVREMPHYEKFTLQKDIRECIDGIMDEIEAYERSKTISHLYTADRLKGKLVRKIRLAHDLGYSAMNNRVYEYCAEQIGIMGACIGGLINKAQAEKRK